VQKHLSDQERIRHSIPLLLAWHKENRKDLPWRQNPTPYHVWLSEIMLQQTRIEAVIPYYLRFLSELPDIAALATVEDERLMKLWQGLGYYSRARNLKRAAKIIMEEHGGALPQDLAALKRLPGIGDYTAGAIASLAFGLPEPAVDGNVLRVGMRLLGSEEDVMLPATKVRLSALLRAIYPSGTQASALTEAWMELGEHVCIPNGTPRCHNCPLANLCQAKQMGLCDRLPRKSPKKAKKEEKLTVLLLYCDGKIALRQRPKQGLLASLWEFPNLAGHLSAEQAWDAAYQMGFSPMTIEPCPPASHLFTHIHWDMVGYFLRCESAPEDAILYTQTQIEEEIAIPTAFGAFRKEAFERLNHTFLS